MEKKHYCMLLMLLLAMLPSYAFAQLNANDYVGNWKGSCREVYGDGTPSEYRWIVEFQIKESLKFEAEVRNTGGGRQRWSSEDVVFENNNTNVIKYYIESIDDDWTDEEFQGKKIGRCVIKFYETLELKDDAIIYKRIGKEETYYNKKGKYIGKEWVDEKNFACVLHKQ